MKEYKIEKLRSESEAGITHALVLIDSEGMFLTPDKRYPKETVLFAGTESECLSELKALSPAKQRDKLRSCLPASHAPDKPDGGEGRCE